MRDTRDEGYAARLARPGTGWKRLLHVQAPYLHDLRRQQLGRTLDIGCGVGRNLPALAPGSVGVDHNPTSVAIARRRGHLAMTPQEFVRTPLATRASFDALLLAHVVEHLPRAAAADLLRSYLPYLRPAGTVFLICPQERGYASDDTHVQFTTGHDLEELARAVGLDPQGWYSFPLPRWAGRAFTYNEFRLRATAAPAVEPLTPPPSAN
jgi:SAM-dependent methyltransferase